jgi:hypothetical protein
MKSTISFLIFPSRLDHFISWTYSRSPSLLLEGNADGATREQTDGSSNPQQPPRATQTQTQSRRLHFTASLNKEVVPAFYNRDSDAIPRRWLKMVREAIRTVGS